jgi:hypothetical protein
VDESPPGAKPMRIMGLSVVGGLFAPLVFVSIMVLRKFHRRTKVLTRHWGRRLSHEIARWT